jgi:hypothetical protein
MDADMRKNDTIRLMYANRYAGVANYHKKWGGEMLGLQKSNAVEKKQQFEKGFLKLVAADANKTEKYSNLFLQFKKTYQDYAPLSKQYDYYTECLMGIDAIRMISWYPTLFAELKKKQEGKENKYEAKLKELPAIPFKNFNKETDRKLCVAMLEMYAKEIDKSLRPYLLDSLLTAYKNNIPALTDFLYNNSSYVDNVKAKQMFSDFEKNYQLYERDPFYLLAKAITQHYQRAVTPQVNYYELQINDLQKEYMKGLRENIKDKKFYPDANGTLRVAFGKVADYKPRDGVEYLPYTTIDGMVEKNKTGLADFYVKPRLLELYEKKDFGPYTDKNGKLRIAFTGSNHTTGGNSGSPVINAKGELIGTNFDRNWEGTMSDVMYNGAFCRNIVLDVRFTLWVIDKYAGAGYLLNEMKLVK